MGVRDARAEIAHRGFIRPKRAISQRLAVISKRPHREPAGVWPRHVMSAHRVVLALLRVCRLTVEADTSIRAAPMPDGGRALSRGRATARPSPQAVSAHSGHDRSA